MKKVNWPTIAALALVALVFFMTWGIYGGLSGRMGPGWSMMGSGWGMFFLTLCFTAFLSALVLWVARNRKK